VALLVTACGGDCNCPTAVPTATEAATSCPLATPYIVIVTATAAFPSPTPTITWTPSATPTPTITPTPTQTYTPTITPTLTNEEICAGFSGSLLAFPGVSYPLDTQATFFAVSDFPDTVIVLTITNLGTGESKSATLPGGQSFLGRFPLNLGMGLGEYSWSLSVSAQGQTGLCERLGGFILVGEAAEETEASTQPPIPLFVTATPNRGEATPEITP